jgi:ferredoxin-NADP reductase
MTTEQVTMASGLDTPRPSARSTGRPDGMDDADVWLTVKQVTHEAEGVFSLVLIDPQERELQAWKPGAHLEFVLPSGRIRQYSLCGHWSDRYRYKVAVLRENEGRGGSAELHQTALAGASVQVRGPRNRFELIDAPRYVFVAGGIGITPILPMVREVACQRPWRLFYGGRTRRSMAFVDELLALGGTRVDIVPQDEQGALDLDQIFAAADGETAIYCCGPPGLIAAVEERCGRERRSATLHVERFVTGAARPAASTGNAPEQIFEVKLQRTGTTVKVEAGQSVLEAIRRVIPAMPSSCEEGICGTCEVRVLDGTPDHRDSILSESERRAGDSMFVCVSRARTPRLVLDL